MTYRFLSPYKVLRYPERIEALKNNSEIFPVTMEIDLTNTCDHNCVWCLDRGFRLRVSESLPRERVFSLLDEFRACGVEGLVIKGSGEPLLVGWVPELLYAAREKGFRLAVTTNGGRLFGRVAEAVVDTCDWVRVSVDAGSEAVHNIVHRPRVSCFHQILGNIGNLVDMKRERNSRIMVGYKVSVDENNYHEIVQMTGFAKGLGCDIITLREVDLGCHGYDDRKFRAVVASGGIGRLMDEAKKLEGDGFLVSASGGARIRRDWDKVGVEDGGRGCLINRFIGVLSADGNLYACVDLKGQVEFCLGNVLGRGFREVWLGESAGEVRARCGAGRMECREWCSLKYEVQNEVLNHACGVGRVGVVEHAEFL